MLILQVRSHSIAWLYCAQLLICQELSKDRTLNPDLSHVIIVTPVWFLQVEQQLTMHRIQSVYVLPSLRVTLWYLSHEYVLQFLQYQFNSANGVYQ